MSSDIAQAEQLGSRWPKDEDRLFVECAWVDDAHIVRDPVERFYRMPMGYKRAGDILVDQAGTNATDRRNVSYAAIFCYRQSVELFLKGLIQEFGGQAAPKTHKLQPLWDGFISILKERGMDEPEELALVERLVAELHQADANSDAFRFPAMKDGRPFDFGDRGIDLENLREVMEGVANFFESVSLAFSHQDDLRSEAMLFSM